MVDYERRIKELPKGSQILHEPLLNKGTGFTAKERKSLDLVGLLPPTILTIEEQKELQKRFVDKLRSIASE